MRTKKRVRCDCYGPIACGRRYESPWEDVWITYHERRRVVRKGPTLSSRRDLVHSIERDEWFLAQPEKTIEELREAWRAWASYFDVDDNSDEALRAAEESQRAFTRNELDKSRDRLARLDASPDGLLIEEHDRPKIPDIYTRAEWITRPEAERMIAKLIGRSTETIAFRWPYPRVVVIPS